ncbi:aldo/keto reductase [Plantactinospora soyae]|uniref:NADP-dependent oxidoreductase domain-containing protein n=1 Tax=Plantactinospora soyae TaxID=1544732 RepID=A0A927MFH0_9ACTN|nr:aldo/keto reductase [Plantactinospora soyae]MBE1492822.1 hypothetical protein [Plantactinospora soyae]
MSRRPGTPLISLQLPYSLIARGVEPEFVPMAQSLGLGLTAWSPIGGGLLTGKYRRTGDGLAGDGRLGAPGGHQRPIGEREWRVIEVLEGVAAELGRSMAQVAINWVATRPSVGSAIIGASSPEQLASNMAALDFEIPSDARRRLDEASAVRLAGGYSMFTPEYQSWIVNPGSRHRRQAGRVRPAGLERRRPAGHLTPSPSPLPLVACRRRRCRCHCRRLGLGLGLGSLLLGPAMWARPGSAGGRCP